MFIVYSSFSGIWLYVACLALRKIFLHKKSMILNCRFFSCKIDLQKRQKTSNVATIDVSTLASTHEKACKIQAINCFSLVKFIGYLNFCSSMYPISRPIGIDKNIVSSIISLPLLLSWI